MAVPVEVVRLITTFKRNAIQHQIDATDKEIDRLVYELYGLTDDEIRIVEEPRRQTPFCSAQTTARRRRRRPAAWRHRAGLGGLLWA